MSKRAKNKNSRQSPAHTRGPTEQEDGMTIDKIAGPLRVDAEDVRRHVAAGAPVETNDQINLFHYAAWLIKEMADAS